MQRHRHLLDWTLVKVPLQGFDQSSIIHNVRVLPADLAFGYIFFDVDFALCWSASTDLIPN